MLRIFPIAGLLHACLANPVLAQTSDYYSIQDLLVACEKAQATQSTGDFNLEDAVDIGYCLGMARATMDLLELNCSTIAEGYNPLYAATGMASTGAAVQAFINWSRANPQHWGLPAIGGFALAIHGSFPCNR